MKKSVLLIIFLIFFLNNIFSQWTVDNIPDPMQNSSYVANPDGILSDSTVNNLNSMIKAADDSGYVQIAVLMLSSIGDQDPKTLAHEILNKWGVGKANSNNGLVIVFVMDKRTVSFETGYGTEAVITDAECYLIQQDYMVPYFKNQDYELGMNYGVYACIEEAKTDNYLLVEDNSNPADYENNYNYDYTKKTFKDITKSSLFILYAFITACLTILFFLLFFISLGLSDRYKRYQTLRIFSLIIFAILFPIPFIGIVIWTRALMEKWRNTPRMSPNGLLMHKLNETQDDKYLKSGQISEERVKSIDYDVWITDDNEEFLILAYKRWFSKYSSCPKCKFKTYYLEYDRVITAATYSHSGTGEKKHSCANCGHSVTRRYTIPKKQQTSSSSGSYSSWGGGGSSSWGGGSSGGGGASSSW